MASTFYVLVFTDTAVLYFLILWYSFYGHFLCINAAAFWNEEAFYSQALDLERELGHEA